MKTKQVIEAAHRLSKPYRVRNGKKFRLKDVDPGDTGELQSEDKTRAKEALQTGVGALTELQDMLYGQDRWSLLLIFQAMDAAGKFDQPRVRLFAAAFGVALFVFAVVRMLLMPAA